MRVANLMQLLQSKLQSSAANLAKGAKNERGSFLAVLKQSLIPEKPTESSTSSASSFSLSTGVDKSLKTPQPASRNTQTPGPTAIIAAEAKSTNAKHHAGEKQSDGGKREDPTAAKAGQVGQIFHRIQSAVLPILNGQEKAAAKQTDAKATEKSIEKVSFPSAMDSPAQRARKLADAVAPLESSIDAQTAFGDLNFAPASPQAVAKQKSGIASTVSSKNLATNIPSAPSPSVAGQNKAEAVTRQSVGPAGNLGLTRESVMRMSIWSRIMAPIVKLLSPSTADAPLQQNAAQKNSISGTESGRIPAARGSEAKSTTSKGEISQLAMEKGVPKSVGNPAVLTSSNPAASVLPQTAVASATNGRSTETSLRKNSGVSSELVNKTESSSDTFQAVQSARKETVKALREEIVLLDSSASARGHTPLSGHREGNAPIRIAQKEAVLGHTDQPIAGESFRASHRGQSDLLSSIPKSGSAQISTQHHAEALKRPLTSGVQEPITLKAAETRMQNEPANPPAQSSVKGTLQQTLGAIRASATQLSRYWQSFVRASEKPTAANMQIVPTTGNKTAVSHAQANILSEHLTGKPNPAEAALSPKGNEKTGATLRVQVTARVAARDTNQHAVVSEQKPGDKIPDSGSQVKMGEPIKPDRSTITPANTSDSPAAERTARKFWGMELLKTRAQSKTETAIRENVNASTTQTAEQTAPPSRARSETIVTANQKNGISFTNKSADVVSATTGKQNAQSQLSSTMSPSAKSPNPGTMQSEAQTSKPVSLTRSIAMALKSMAANTVRQAEGKAAMPTSLAATTASASQNHKSRVVPPVTSTKVDSGMGSANVSRSSTTKRTTIRGTTIAGRLPEERQSSVTPPVRTAMSDLKAHKAEGVNSPASAERPVVAPTASGGSAAQPAPIFDKAGIPLSKRETAIQSENQRQTTGSADSTAGRTDPHVLTPDPGKGGIPLSNRVANNPINNQLKTSGLADPSIPSAKQAVKQPDLRAMTPDPISDTRVDLKNPVVFNADARRSDVSNSIDRTAAYGAQRTGKSDVRIQEPIRSEPIGDTNRSVQDRTGSSPEGLAASQNETARFQTAEVQHNTPLLRTRMTAMQIRELQEMVERAVQKVHATSNGVADTQFSWRSDALGILNFRVATNQNEVRVEIRSASSDAAEAIEEAKPAMERAIADLGLRIERFEVKISANDTIADRPNYDLETGRERRSNPERETKQPMNDPTEPEIQPQGADSPGIRIGLTDHEWLA